MELYFSEFVDYGVEEQLPWFDVALEVNQSAFVKFKDQPRKAFPLNNQNLNKKMVDFLKKSWIGSVGVETEKERNHKHMINERMRREKEKQSYIELHNLLPNGTKASHNSPIPKIDYNINCHKKKCYERYYSLKIVCNIFYYTEKSLFNIFLLQNVIKDVIKNMNRQLLKENIHFICFIFDFKFWFL